MNHHPLDENDMFIVKKLEDWGAPIEYINGLPRFLLFSFDKPGSGRALKIYADGWIENDDLLGENSLMNNNANNNAWSILMSAIGEAYRCQGK